MLVDLCKFSVWVCLILSSKCCSSRGFDGDYIWIIELRLLRKVSGGCCFVVEMLLVISNDFEDVSLYVLVIEESNVSWNFIDIEIEWGVCCCCLVSFFILVVDGSKVSYIGGNMSDILVILIDSFFDGFGGIILFRVFDFKSLDYVVVVVVGLGVVVSVIVVFEKFWIWEGGCERVVVIRFWDKERDCSKYKFSKSWMSSVSKDDKYVDWLSRRLSKGYLEFMVLVVDFSMVLLVFVFSYWFVD